MTVSGPMSAYLEVAYDETMALVDDSWDCMSQAQRSDAAEMMLLSRTTTDVSLLLAWILVHKAVQSDEITTAKATVHPAHQLPEVRADDGVAARAGWILT